MEQELKEVIATVKQNIPSFQTKIFERLSNLVIMDYMEHVLGKWEEGRSIGLKIALLMDALEKCGHVASIQAISMALMPTVISVKIKFSNGKEIERTMNPENIQDQIIRYGR
jgi:hypothetical protein